MLQERTLTSSMADTAWYDAFHEELFVRFRDSRHVYQYRNVDVAAFDELLSAPSFGRHMNQKIVHLGQFPVRSVARTSTAATRSTRGSRPLCTAGTPACGLPALT